MHKTNCMQSIKKSMWEVLPAIALKNFDIWLNTIIYYIWFESRFVGNPEDRFSREETNFCLCFV